MSTNFDDDSFFDQTDEDDARADLQDAHPDDEDHQDADSEYGEQDDTDFFYVPDDPNDEPISDEEVADFRAFCEAHESQQLERSKRVVDSTPPDAPPATLASALTGDPPASSLSTGDQPAPAPSHALRSKAARRWLSKLFHDETGAVPSPQTLVAAFNVL